MGQHFVPQRYLRNFESPGRPGFIWVHDKLGGHPKHARIEKVAQAKEFYTAATEVALARDVETPANAVIHKLTNDTILTRIERLQLAFYIGVMMKRVPARRRQSAEMVPGIVADVVSRLRDELTKVARVMQTDPELLARRLEDIDAAGTKFTSEPPPEVLDQILEPWPSERMLGALFNMTWRVLVSAGPQYFITTDNPAFFFHQYGLGQEKAELSFPLSTTRALHASWQTAASDPAFLRAPQGMVKEINRRLASQAERLAFHHEPAPWLLTVLPKGAPYLSVIRW